MNLLLARYGLPSSSRLCIDENLAATKTGHADGVFPRTLEVLKSLGIADEILNNAAHVRERGMWAYKEEKGAIERQGAIQSLRLGDHRFGAGFECIHQGRVERILEDDLGLYCETGVVRETKCVGVKIDEASDVGFPIVAILESDGIQKNREDEVSYRS